MAAKTDPYAILGVARSASAAEIRAAYRALVERYHPDRHQGNPLEDLASERMAEINQAYELLSDPVRRGAFDGGGARVADGNGARRGGTDGAPRGPTRAAARPRMNPLAKWGLALILLPLLLRSGGGLLRAVAGLLRALFGELGAFRGTPAVLVVVAIAALLLARALWLRFRRGRS